MLIQLEKTHSDTHKPCYVKQCPRCHWRSVFTVDPACELCGYWPTDIIGPLWAKPLLDFNSKPADNLISMARQSVRPLADRSTEDAPDLTHVEGAESLYVYFGKALQERKVPDQVCSQ